MIHIRTMTDDDLPLGMRLRSQAGFNQTEADWRRFLDLQSDGCFVAELDGEPVGTVTNCVFGPVGWIAMLLVDERFRGRGIGTRLTEHALGYLDGRGVRTARLDATPRGRPIYEKLGFVAEYELARREGTASGGRSHDAVVALAREQLDAVVALDREVTGTDRRRLIERLYQERPEATWGFYAGDQLAGYLTVRDGTNAAQIGPGVALTDEAGRALGDVALEHCAGARVFVDIPTDNVAAVRWAESRGLAVQRYFTRMRRGEPVVDRPSQLWGSSGPEKG
ncbi:MAG TPA: GNAT family N-acetyltransferase [Thermoguttaceae bacterium]|nr:GNAT family N-acetyltransferase [Thermoguttaceae bacterium]